MMAGGMCFRRLYEGGVWYGRPEGDCEDPVVPCRRCADSNPVGRDLLEQYIRGNLRNPGIHLCPDRNRQSGLWTGLRPRGVEDDYRWVRDFHGSSHWGMVLDSDNHDKCLLEVLYQLLTRHYKTPFQSCLFSEKRQLFVLRDDNK